MDLNDRGTLQIAVVLTVALVAVGVIAATGFVFASDEQTGEDVFEDIQEKYKTADSLSADADITVETENGTTAFESSIASTADGKVWLNVSDDDGYVTVGSDGSTAWVYDPQTGVSTALTDGGEQAVTATLRTGTADPSAGIMAFEAFDTSQTVGELLDSVNESALPAAWQDALDEVPRNATLGELADGEYDDVLGNESAAIPGEVDELRGESTGEVTASQLWDGFDGDAIDASALRERFGADIDDWNGSHGDALATLADTEWNESEWPDSVDEFQDRLDTLADRLNESAANRTIELVGTTTIDGQEANELLITAPDVDSETRLWAGVDSNEILKVETTGPEATVTVDVTETRFDVSPADSTFEPPGTTELAVIDVTTTTAASEFGSTVPFDVAVPGEDWEFERGYTVTANTSAEANRSLDGDLLVGVYSADDQSVVVTQSNGTVEFNETVTVGDRAVHIETSDAGSTGIWSENGTTTTVVGPFSESELRSFIESVAVEDRG